MSADLHHLAAAYVLDALDDIERREFEDHYPRCEICSGEVTEFRSVATALAGSTATAAPTGLKSSIMDEIGQTRQLSPLVGSARGRTMGLSRRVLLAAAAVLVLLGGVVVATLPGADDGRSNEVVGALDAVVTPLDPLTGLEGNLQVIWSDELDQVAVVGSRLEDPGSGLAYALWFVLDDGVAPAALFRPENGSISEVIDIDDLDTTGWGITIEPEEGSPQPTGEIIYAGSI